MSTVQEATSRAAREAGPWADRAVAIGYVAKGAVYLLVGGLALAAALGIGGKATDAQGALAAVSRAPGGRFALGLVAIGLAAHVVFRIVLVVAGERYAGGGAWRSVGRRVRHAMSALVYGGMAATAAGLASGWSALRPANHDREAQSWSARVLEIPHGRLLLLAIAIGILIVAAVQLVRAVGPNDIRRYLRVEEMSERLCRTMTALGRVAFFGRAAVLGTIGVLLVRAAIHRAPGAARGPAGAMRSAAAHSPGQIFLVVIACGLIAFGVYALFEARWRRLVDR